MAASARSKTWIPLCLAYVSYIVLLLHQLGTNADTNVESTDEQALKKAGIATDGTGLLEFFRQRRGLCPNRIACPSAGGRVVRGPREGLCRPGQARALGRASPAAGEG